MRLDLHQTSQWPHLSDLGAVQPGRRVSLNSHFCKAPSGLPEQLGRDADEEVGAAVGEWGWTRLDSHPCPQPMMMASWAQEVILSSSTLVRQQEDRWSGVAGRDVAGPKGTGEDSVVRQSGFTSWCRFLSAPPSLHLPMTVAPERGCKSAPGW